MIKIILGALAYIVPSMPWGYFWHLRVFKKEWEYFGTGPSVPLAFIAMVIQGTNSFSRVVVARHAPTRKSPFLETAYRVGQYAPFGALLCAVYLYVPGIASTTRSFP